MKIIVDELPKKPIECIFAQSHLVTPKCSLKANKRPEDLPRDIRYSYIASKDDCSLVSHNAACPYLVAINEISDNLERTE